jgi:aromatic-L-amino-acid decarboxylase
VERADSFVVNPHKMMMVPLDCSLFYTAHPAVLRSACSLEAEYLKTDAVETIDFMDYGIALGRRFRALKLWFVMRYFGRDGLAAILRENLWMAAWLGNQILAEARFELVAPATMGLVCFRLRQGTGIATCLNDVICTSSAPIWCGVGPTAVGTSANFESRFS